MKGFKNKRIKVILIIIGIILVLAVGIFFYIGNKLYELALDPNSDRTQVFTAGHNIMVS